MSLSFALSTVSWIDVVLSIVTFSADAKGIINKNNNANNNNIPFFIIPPPLNIIYLKIYL